MQKGCLDLDNIINSSFIMKKQKKESIFAEYLYKKENLVVFVFLFIITQNRLTKMAK